MNKLKPGDKVQLTTKHHSWETNHIVQCYGVGGSSEFKNKHYEEVAMWLLSKARRAKLKGLVVGYGAQDDDFKDKRNFVHVELFYKDMSLDLYLSEKDVKKIG